MKILMSSFVVFSHALAQCADVSLIVPNNLVLPAEGNTFGWPFTFQDLGVTSRRYQQVYEASQFTAIPLGGYINQLWFRVDMLGQGGPNAADSLDSVQINLGITSRSPDGLSAIFSENVGPLDAVVYGPSPLEISTSTGWAVISLTQPFLYVPGAGNLLLDIRTTDTTPFFPSPRYTFDAEDTVGDSISAVMANDVNASSGFVRSSGLVTHFRIEPIPEPSTWALLALGLLATWQFSLRQTNK